MPKPKTTYVQIFDKKEGEIKFVSLTSVESLNNMIHNGFSADIVNTFEMTQDAHIGHIASNIERHGGVQVIMIAGPSSSGKTTFSKRLALHLLMRGFKPYPISLDDYFVNREDTPIDENGEKDFEHINAVNVKRFNEDMRTLINGGEVELPKYDFKTGLNKPSGRHLKLQEGMILIVEGIHGLNPILTESLPQQNIFRIYVSSLIRYYFTDNESDGYVPRTDQRLIRRIIRDCKYRGISASQSIARWPSVRRGEERWIFPFQQYADEEFCSTLLYELSILKNQALSALVEVRPGDTSYEKAGELIDYLIRFNTIEEHFVPPTSLLREFLGGSSFHY